MSRDSDFVVGLRMELEAKQVDEWTRGNKQVTTTTSKQQIQLI